MTTLSPSQTVTAFLRPIPLHDNISRLQKALLKYAVTTGSPSLAASRLVSFLFDLDISSLLMASVTPVDFSRASPATQQAAAALQDLFNKMAAYRDFTGLALEEARGFLPAPTVTLLNEYNTRGSAAYSVGVAIFLVLAANLQEL